MNLAIQRSAFHLAPVQSFTYLFVLVAASKLTVVTIYHVYAATAGIYINNKSEGREKVRLR